MYIYATIKALSKSNFLQKENEDLQQDNVLLQARINNLQRKLDQANVDLQKAEQQVEKKLSDMFRVGSYFYI